MGDHKIHCLAFFAVHLKERAIVYKDVLMFAYLCINQMKLECCCLDKMLVCEIATWRIIVILFSLTRK